MPVSAATEAPAAGAIASRIREHARRNAAKPVAGQSSILDVGSGMGHHLPRITEALAPPVAGLGLDISRDAARQAGRRWPMLAFGVPGLSSEWEGEDLVTDLAL